MRKLLVAGIVSLMLFSWFNNTVIKPAFESMREQAETAIITPLDHIEKLEQLSNDPDNFDFE